MSYLPPEDYESDLRDRIFYAGTLIFSVGLLLVVIFCLNSCTISFQNISTHGVADDLVEENQSPTTKVDPDFTIPTLGL